MIDPDIHQSESSDSEDELRDRQSEEVSVFLTAQTSDTQRTHHLIDLFKITLSRRGLRYQLCCRRRAESRPQIVFKLDSKRFMILMHLPSTQTPGCCPRLRFITGCGNHVPHCFLHAATGSLPCICRRSHWLVLAYEALLGLLPSYLCVFMCNNQHILRSLTFSQHHPNDRPGNQTGSGFQMCCWCLLE